MPEFTNGFAKSATCATRTTGLGCSFSIKLCVSLIQARRAPIVCSLELTVLLWEILSAAVFGPSLFPTLTVCHIGIRPSRGSGMSSVLSGTCTSHPGGDQIVPGGSWLLCNMITLPRAISILPRSGSSVVIWTSITLIRRPERMMSLVTSSGAIGGRRNRSTVIRTICSDPGFSASRWFVSIS
ncbi:MAG: Uncharacterised protein [Methanobacteriota archaeon]|nr:MAG: Uncharacterised protein [Euryarchaeota archaeon]